MSGTNGDQPLDVNQHRRDNFRAQRKSNTHLTRYLSTILVRIVFNLALSHHVKWLKIKELSNPSKQNIQDADVALRKAQVLYSLVHKNLNDLPSIKYKLVLFNNLGQLFWARNAREEANKCFRAVRRMLDLISIDGTDTSNNDAQQIGIELYRSLLLVSYFKGISPEVHAAAA